VSAFDDEFGLFSDESDESERRSTLGARNITGGDSPKGAPKGDVAPEKPRAGAKPRAEKPRAEAKPRAAAKPRSEKTERTERTERPPQQQARPSRSPNDPWASQRRATELVDFLARHLVSKPDDVTVELFQDEDGKPVIEVVVDSEDIGKVIGRSGRVAQALRTIARATAEGRVSVDILDKNEAEEAAEDDEDAD
jgi:predicted RNA-binding protein YlqC (UPF0109 family)